MFVRTAVAAVASAWVAAAQTSSDSVTHHTHAAFAFVRTGERTPFLANASQTLTALGAKQMYELGQNFRTRYIAGDQPQKLGVQRIAGMSVDTLNNDQIWVQTLDRPYLISSAQAFMQGLYPPSNSSSATSQLADGTSVEYPFNGYQYANIRTASQTDPDSRYLAGLQNCPAGQTSAMNYFSTEAFRETESASEDLFNKLDPDWLDGTLPEAYFDIRSVLEISDYISYQYVHNSTMHDILSANNSNYTGVYDRLNYLADQVAWGLYGNTSESSRVSNNQAIGGKSLASSILNTFRMHIAQQRGMSDDSAMTVSLPPLTLYFGDQDPMISLASLLRLDTKSPYFQSIPPYGSAMVFELFSVSNSSSGTVEMPTNPDDLWVRFSFHNATATGNSSNNDQLTAYPMFNNGPSNTDVQWIDFEPLFGDIALGGIAHWCDECNSGSIFCSGADGSPYFRDGDRGGRGRKPKKGDDDDDDDDDGMSPAVAGVIGAVVTLIVATLLFALFMFLAGLRFRRVQKPNLFKKAKSGLGGFKGSSKMASDPDLALARNGAAMPVAPPPIAVDVASGAAGATGDHKYAYHERSGSWELRQKEFGKDVKLVERESLDEGGAKVVQPRNGV